MGNVTMIVIPTLPEIRICPYKDFTTRTLFSGTKWILLKIKRLILTGADFFGLRYAGGV